MTIRQQKRILQEARRQAYIGAHRLFTEKVNTYHKLVLNEGFFDKVKDFGRSLGQGIKAQAADTASLSTFAPEHEQYGGATAQNLQAGSALQKLKSFKSKVDGQYKTLINIKLSDIGAMEAALDGYVTSLINMFEAFKDVTENVEADETHGSEVVTQIANAVTSSFKTAKKLIQDLADAASTADGLLKSGVPSNSTVAMGSNPGEANSARRTRQGAPPAPERPAFSNVAGTRSFQEALRRRRLADLARRS